MRVMRVSAAIGLGGFSAIYLFFDLTGARSPQPHLHATRTGPRHSEVSHKMFVKEI